MPCIVASPKVNAAVSFQNSLAIGSTSSHAASYNRSVSKQQPDCKEPSFEVYELSVADLSIVFHSWKTLNKGEYALMICCYEQLKHHIMSIILLDFDGDEGSSDVEDEEDASGATNSPLHLSKIAATPSSNATVVASIKKDGIDTLYNTPSDKIEETVDVVLMQSMNSNDGTQKSSSSDRTKTLQFEGTNPMRDSGEQTVPLQC